MMIPLGDVISLQKGKKPKIQSKEPLDGYLPNIDIKAFEQGKYEYYTDGVGCLPCEDGDILIVCDGSRSGLVGIAKKGVVGSTLAKITISSCVDKKFLLYFIQSHYTELNTHMKGTGTPHVNPALLSSFQFPVVSESQQRRIVEKIDALFSELDKGVEMFQTIRQQLRTYRQAVLKWAFEGIDWNFVPLSKITEYVTSGSRGWAKYYTDEGAKFVRIGNLTREGIKLLSNDIQCVTLPKGAEGLRSLLKTNDMLISITADLGSIGIVSDNFGEAYINQHIALTRFNKPDMVKFYAWYLKSDNGRKSLLKNQRGGTKVGLGLDDVRESLVPDVTEEIANEIVKSIESRLSVCDKLEQLVDENIAKSQALRQSILKKAFAGQLVPQDPNDEPAEKLLERIKAATTQASPKRKKK
jgi:type I restriction enzyme S subunit